MADFFVRPPTLITGNFEALTDFKFLALKDLNLLKKYYIYGFSEPFGII